jgi:hypothetical protein
VEQETCRFKRAGTSLLTLNGAPETKVFINKAADRPPLRESPPDDELWRLLWVAWLNYGFPVVPLTITHASFDQCATTWARICQENNLPKPDSYDLPSNGNKYVSALSKYYMAMRVIQSEISDKKKKNAVHVKCLINRPTGWPLTRAQNSLQERYNKYLSDSRRYNLDETDVRMEDELIYLAVFYDLMRHDTVSDNLISSTLDEYRAKFNTIWTEADELPHLVDVLETIVLRPNIMIGVDSVEFDMRRTRFHRLKNRGYIYSDLGVMREPVTHERMAVEQMLMNSERLFAFRDRYAGTSRPALPSGENYVPVLLRGNQPVLQNYRDILGDESYEPRMRHYVPTHQPVPRVPVAWPPTTDNTDALNALRPEPVSGRPLTVFEQFERDQEIDRLESASAPERKFRVLSAAAADSDLLDSLRRTKNTKAEALSAFGLFDNEKPVATAITNSEADELILRLGTLTRSTLDNWYNKMPNRDCVSHFMTVDDSGSPNIHIMYYSYVPMRGIEYVKAGAFLVDKRLTTASAFGDLKLNGSGFLSTISYPVSSDGSFWYDRSPIDGNSWHASALCAVQDAYPMVALTGSPIVPPGELEGKASATHGLKLVVVSPIVVELPVNAVDIRLYHGNRPLTRVPQWVARAVEKTDMFGVVVTNARTQINALARTINLLGALISNPRLEMDLGVYNTVHLWATTSNLHSNTKMFEPYKEEAIDPTSETGKELITSLLQTNGGRSTIRQLQQQQWRTNANDWDDFWWGFKKGIIMPFEYVGSLLSADDTLPIVRGKLLTEQQHVKHDGTVVRTKLTTQKKHVDEMFDSAKTDETKKQDGSQNVKPKIPPNTKKAVANKRGLKALRKASPVIKSMSELEL